MGYMLGSSCSSCCKKCGTRSNAGGAGITIENYDMPSEAGYITFTYDAYYVPDHFIISDNDNNILFDTGGPVSGYKSVVVYKPRGVTSLNIRVEGPEGTAWTYTIGCPTGICFCENPVDLPESIKITFQMNRLTYTLGVDPSYEDFIKSQAADLLAEVNDLSLTLIRSQPIKLITPDVMEIRYDPAPSLDLAPAFYSESSESTGCHHLQQNTHLYGKTAHNFIMIIRCNRLGNLYRDGDLYLGAGPHKNFLGISSNTPNPVSCLTPQNANRFITVRNGMMYFCAFNDDPYNSIYDLSYLVVAKFISSNDECAIAPSAIYSSSLYKFKMNIAAFADQPVIDIKKCSRADKQRYTFKASAVGVGDGFFSDDTLVHIDLNYTNPLP